MSVAPPMTADEFFALPPRRDAAIVELVRGELVVHEPSPAHQAAVGNLHLKLGAWCRSAPHRGFVLLPVDTGISDDSVLVPDLQWWGPGRTLPAPDVRPQPLGDLIVEARSPSTWSYDTGVKRELYEASGARELWLVDGYSQSVIVLRRSTPDAPRFDVSLELQRGESLSSPLLPGFAISIDEVFELPWERA